MARQKRLLIIEDDKIIRMGLRTMLTAAGYDVQSAEGGSEGLRMLSNDSASFDGVIVDLLMPQPDGFEVIRTLRAKDPLFCARAPIVILSVVGDTEPAVQRLIADGARYLLKIDADTRLQPLLLELLGCEIS